MGEQVFEKFREVNDRFKDLQKELPDTAAAKELKSAFQQYRKTVLSFYRPDQNESLKKRYREDFEGSYKRLMKVCASFAKAERENPENRQMPRSIQWRDDAGEPVKLDFRQQGKMLKSFMDAVEACERAIIDDAPWQRKVRGMEALKNAIREREPRKASPRAVENSLRQRSGRNADEDRGEKSDSEDNDNLEDLAGLLVDFADENQESEKSLDMVLSSLESFRPEAFQSPPRSNESPKQKRTPINFNSASPITRNTRPQTLYRTQPQFTYQSPLLRMDAPVNRQIIRQNNDLRYKTMRQTYPFPVTYKSPTGTSIHRMAARQNDLRHKTMRQTYPFPVTYEYKPQTVAPIHQQVIRKNNLIHKTGVQTYQSPLNRGKYLT